MSRLLLATTLGIVFASAAPAAGPDAGKAEAALKKAGAVLTRDAKQEGNPVVGVALKGDEVRDGLLEQVQAFPHLQSLELTDTLVTSNGLASLKGMAELKKVVLNDNLVKDEGMEHLAALPALEWLEVVREDVTDKGAEALKGATKLKHLSFRLSHVGDDGLEHLKDLKNLEFLDIYQTNVKGRGLKHLEGLTKLKQLEIDPNRVDDDAVKRLVKALPMLKVAQANEKVID